MIIKILTLKLGKNIKIIKKNVVSLSFSTTLRFKLPKFMIHLIVFFLQNINFSLYPLRDSTDLGYRFENKCEIKSVQQLLCDNIKTHFAFTHDRGLFIEAHPASTYF